MSDFTSDLYFSDDVIKQEPLVMGEMAETALMSQSASVPIPGRREIKYDNYGIDEFINSQTQLSPMLSAVWNTKLVTDTSSQNTIIRMDDDDIFQVDKNDLIQGPTLAELNANDDTLLEDLNFDDFILPDERTLYKNLNALKYGQVHSPSSLLASSCPVQNLDSTFRDNIGTLTVQTNMSMPSSPFDPFSPKSMNSSSLLSTGAFSPLSQNSSDSMMHNYSNTSSPPPNLTPLTSPPTAAAPKPTPRAMTKLQQRHSTLHELLMMNRSESCRQRSTISESSACPSTSTNPSPFGPFRTRTIPSPSYSTTGTPTTGTTSFYTQLTGGAAGGATGLSTMRATSRVQPSHSRLSTSAPTHLGADQIWARREPRQHLLSTGSLAEAESTSSLSTGGILSPEAYDFSHDEGFDSDDSDEGQFIDYSTDDDSDIETNATNATKRPSNRPSKKDRYFWQYNVQSKGPKGQRLMIKTKQEDPHVLNAVTDPVFAPDFSLRGIKHSGKARKGDGNDLTPNARKLNSIGRELDKLNKIINDITPVSELPQNVRPKTRKEKNKLASRACRLKKKAQHEANKIKLYGLENEHRRLINGISQVKQLLRVKFTETNADAQAEQTKQIDKIAKTVSKLKIAGNSTEFVNRVLERARNGVPGGGLDEF